VLPVRVPESATIAARPVIGTQHALGGLSWKVDSDMRLQPLGDKIIVKRMEAAETTAGGIVLPDAARERPQQGRVLSVGAGRRLPDGTYAPPQVQEGDRVVFSTYAGAPVVVENDELLILREDDILAVLD